MRENTEKDKEGLAETNLLLPDTLAFLFMKRNTWPRRNSLRYWETLFSLPLTPSATFSHVFLFPVGRVA